MKLEEGCWLKIKDKHEPTTSLTYVLTTNKKGEEIESIYIYYPDEYCFRIDDLSRISEIIGKEPMLNDVLKWVLQNPRGKHFDPTGMGGFMLRNYNTRGTVDFVEWDLTKPYLKDQSKELINWLYELIREER